MSDLIVSVPDHCLSFYFEKKTILLQALLLLFKILIGVTRKCYINRSKRPKQGNINNN